MTRKTTAAVVALALVVGGLALVAALTVGNRSAACDAPIAEPIDPLSSQHLLPGAPEPGYLTNPPTSGAHRPGPLPDRVLTSPLDRPAQVNALEGGRVLIQYGTVTPETRRILVALAHRYNYVTVAPGRELPAKIVATAWLTMLRCDRIDTGALRTFITAHAKHHSND